MADEKDTERGERMTASKAIEKAIKTLKAYYSYALEQPYIRKPLAWALYKTWKKFDEVEP